MKDVLNLQRVYFKEYGQEISRRNLKLMQTVCYAGLIFYVVYYLVTFLFFPDKMISFGYAIMIPILVLFDIRIKYRLKSEDLSFHKTELLTLMMHITLLVYMIAMSTMAHPDLQAVYYPLFLLLGPVMFILPVYQQLLVNGLSFPLFCFAEMYFKEEYLWSHDLFESITAIAFSVVMIFLMTQFRVQGETLKNQYYRLSRHDGLTGLLNKTTGTLLAKEYIENDTLKENFALVLLDIDKFKHINDTYGHTKGDEILQKVGGVLSRAFRDDDIVTRFGGDEFAVVLKNVTKQNVVEKMTGLRKMIQEVDEVDFTCSMGVFIGMCGKDTYSDAMKAADDLMYQAKRNGRNQFFINE